MRLDRSPRLDGKASCASTFCALHDDHEGPHEDMTGNTWDENLGERCVVCRCWLHREELGRECCGPCGRDL